MQAERLFPCQQQGALEEMLHREREYVRRHLQNLILYLARKAARRASTTNILLPPSFRDRRMFLFATSAVSQSSELVPQCQLHFSGAVYSSKDRSECAVAWPRVGSAENMPVECIDELGL